MSVKQLSSVKANTTKEMLMNILIEMCLVQSSTLNYQIGIHYTSTQLLITKNESLPNPPKYD